MRFSEKFEIESSADDDWFDPLLFSDTELFVDPFLIYIDDEPRWKSAHTRLQQFFNLVLGLVAESKGQRRSLAWGKAERLLLFPEPNEFCLGYSQGVPHGSGSGRGLQTGILLGALAAYKRGIEELKHLEELTLFQSGFGADRISDIVCNVLKHEFVRYTQDVALDHGLPMSSLRVRHADWDAKHLRWIDRACELPKNPYNGDPVLLVPQRFLRRLPSANPDDFWDWSWSNENETIRADFNYDLASNVDPETKARLARLHPDVVRDYLAHLEAHPKKPYDVRRDPKVFVRLWERGEALASDTADVEQDAPSETMCRFVKELIVEFKHSIEHSSGWRLLWDTQGKTLSEKKVQALMRFGFIHYTKAHDVDLSPESDAGRGPVDFKFSRGWKDRALVEVKLAKNTKFWDGLQKQTVQYLRSEQIACGFFVAIAYTDADIEKSRSDRITKVASSVSQRAGVSVEPIVIDARKKESASKL